MNQIVKAPPSNDKMSVIKGLINNANMQQALKDVGTSVISKERLCRVAMVAVSRSPLLLQCTPMSIVEALMDATAMGIEPNGPLGMGWLVPYKNNKNNTWEAKFMASYKGMLDLARRSGNIASIEVQVVYEKDVWEVENGFDPKLKHIPCFDADPGKPRLVFALARLRDGSIQKDIMPMHEIEKIRRTSKTGENGPWRDWWEEMAKKSVLKRLCKLLPLSVENQAAKQLAKVIAMDNAVESGEEYIDADKVELPADPTDGFDTPAAEQPKSKTDTLADKLGG